MHVNFSAGYLLDKLNETVNTLQKIGKRKMSNFPL